jgi:hypothetical protein
MEHLLLTGLTSGLLSAATLAALALLRRRKQQQAPAPIPARAPRRQPAGNSR